jgi:NAD(P)-dependent dehydrogenase (short-subunit alcohol dehydrogenase family)
MTNAMFDLSGKTVLVTGGNSGLGLGFAVGLGGAGASVVVWGRRADANDRAIEQLSADGVDAEAAAVDVRDEQAVIGELRRLAERRGHLDCVIANAGFARAAESIADVTTDDYRSHLATNLDGAFFTIREAFRIMREQVGRGGAGGSLITVGSLMSQSGLGGLEAYAMAKAGLGGLTRTVAVDGGPDGIRCNMICPGYINTPPSAARAANPDAPITRRLEQHSPMRRWGRPEDLAGIAVYLASDASRFHTGDTIHVDGGWNAWSG